jgi:hypothetical protein
LKLTQQQGVAAPRYDPPVAADAAAPILATLKPALNADAVASGVVFSKFLTKHSSYTEVSQGYLSKYSY